MCFSTYPWALRAYDRDNTTLRTLGVRNQPIAARNSIPENWDGRCLYIYTNG